VRRKWAIALGAAGVVVVLTGCSTILTALSINGASSGSSVTPSAGECWQETHAQLRLWATWSGAKPVACTQPHQAFTFAVMTLTEKFTGSWLTNGGSPNLRADIERVTGTRPALAPAALPRRLKPANSGRLKPANSVCLLLCLPPSGVTRLGSRRQCAHPALPP